jgi:hypothetical protein
LSIDVSKRQLSITVERKAMVWLSLIPIGLTLGGLAGWLQLQILRYGKLAESQLSVFWVTFICTGLVLSLAGGVIGRALLRAARADSHRRNIDSHGSLSCVAPHQHQEDA